MKFLTTSVLALICGTAAFAEDHDHRELAAHVHGTGQLDIALEGTALEILLTVPGADLVGFEHAPTSEADKAAVAEAETKLADPLSLFGLSAKANCRMDDGHWGLGDHDALHAHDHEDHADDEDHDHEHEHEAHEDHEDHDEHADAGHEHSEFFGHYKLTCDTLDAAPVLTPAYFDLFPNAQKLDIRMVSDTGAHAAQVNREAPEISLKDLF